MKATIFETASWEQPYLSKILKKEGIGAKLVQEPLTERSLYLTRNSCAISVFIYSKLTASLTNRLKGVRFIATRSTGIDHIDLEACHKNNILVSNVPAYGEYTVAEHTFALILALSRNIHKAYVRTVKGDFSLTGLHGFDLKGKTLGIIGAGRIGMHVIKMARGFGMRVLAFDNRKDSFLSDVLDFKYVNLNTLLTESDIVSLHLPYMKYTHHIMDRDKFRIMKKGALLINTARGSLINTNDLVWALDHGIIGGAGLDVLEGEELVREERQLLEKDFSKDRLITALKTHILLHRENVVITPHIGFDSKEALERIMETTIANIIGFKKRNPINLVSIKSK